VTLLLAAENHVTDVLRSFAWKAVSLKSRIMCRVGC